MSGGGDVFSDSVVEWEDKERWTPQLNADIIIKK